MAGSVQHTAVLHPCSGALSISPRVVRRSFMYLLPTAEKKEMR